MELLEAYGVFAGAFIMRPIGGVLFGIIGDKKGRKYALQISMILMFFSTFSIGCLPSESSIGIWSPILLLILRLFQGISVGGQLIGSILFIVGLSLFGYQNNVQCIIFIFVINKKVLNQVSVDFMEELL